MHQNKKFFSKNKESFKIVNILFNCKIHILKMIILNINFFFLIFSLYIFMIFFCRIVDKVIFYNEKYITELQRDCYWKMVLNASR